MKKILEKSEEPST